MKRILLLVLSVISISLICANNPKNNTVAKNNTQDNSHETIGRIAAIVNLFGNVLANPNDPKNVALSICGMIASILNLAADTRAINQLNLQAAVLEILKSGKKDDIEMLQNIVAQLCRLQIAELATYIQNSEPTAIVQ